MALVLKDRVKETTTTTGTGTVTLAGAVTGFDSFSVIGDTNTTYYAIVAQTPGEWEVGVGTYTSAGTTLARTTVLANSAGTQPSALSFSAGTKDVFVTYPAGAAIVASDNPGTSGQVLTSNGAGVAPTWEDAGGGGGALTISNKTAAYTVVAGDLGKIINCTSGTFTVSLTAAATLGAGFNCWVWNTSATATDTITIDPSGAETIDGLATRVLRRGEGMQIICDGTNFQTGDKKTMRGYAENVSATNAAPVASATAAICIGSSSTASGTAAHAFGYNVTASSNYATAIGSNSSTNGSQAVTGPGAMALGGSYASGTDSFAAAVANNTSSYGATGANAVALSQTAKATGTNAVAIGKLATATGTGAMAIGPAGTATGYGASASGENSVAMGDGASATVYGKFAYSQRGFGNVADAQYGFINLIAPTTDATATKLSSNRSTAAANNQVILPNNSAYAFSGIVVAKQSGSTNAASWKVEGMVVRGANAASTTLVFSTVMAISNLPLWTLALSADTTNGGLAVTATGAAATNIRWVATIQTSEVTYA